MLSDSRTKNNGFYDALCARSWAHQQHTGLYDQERALAVRWGVSASMSNVEQESDDSTLDLRWTPPGRDAEKTAAGQTSRSPSAVSDVCELEREEEKLVEPLDISDAKALTEAIQRSDSPVAAKLRSYQGKPLPVQQHEQMPSARSGSSGISELARESEKLLDAIHASAAAPLVSHP